MGFVALHAQDSTTKKPALELSGYAEIYYVKDFNRPQNHTRPAFVYSHNASGEVSLNLAYLKAAYATDKVRANFALATGTYMNANLASEQGVMKNVYEANAGVRVSSRSNVWLDAGIFASHIGFESAVGKDCWNLTRSILADNSPYYETGVKISYTTADSRWMLSALVLNGWQRIHRVDGNTTPAFGTQVQFKPNDRVLLNSSTFIGNDKPDTASQWRYFHNFYGVFQLSKAVAATVGFDCGMEQQSRGSRQMNAWYSPVLITRFNTSKKSALALRAEYYSDAHEVIIAAGVPGGFRTWGFSGNMDFAIASNALLRFEARHFTSSGNVFEKNSGRTKNNTFLATALAISF